LKPFFSYLKFSITVFILLQASSIKSQVLDEQDQRFVVRGSVIDINNNKPVDSVSIEVNGRSYAVTRSDGNFNIKVKINDLLTIKHKDFQTVYHTITGNDRILIQVEPEGTSSQSNNQKTSALQFNQLIDSAQVYLKKDAEKSLQFIVEALKKSNLQSQNNKAYQTLGNLYMHWQQYDLAITNYRIALQNVDNTETHLKLAKAYAKNNNYKESFQIYESLKKAKLTNNQKTELYEGLGDVYVSTNAISKGIESYQDGLSHAIKNNQKAKQTDLNSKIASAYNLSGDKSKAKVFFDNSLSLASKQSEKRAVEEKVTVAEFNNENRNYTDEIALRKEVITAVKSIERDSLISNESPITAQKQNYKIGNALMLQNNPRAAISYFDKSIAEADLKQDLEVKIDATRRKATAYENLGEYDKAKETFQDFMASVDELYMKKRQEIAETARLSRKFAENQNRITSLENDRELNRSRYELTTEKNKSQQIIIYTLVGGLLVLLLAIVFTIKYIKQQRLANNLLALKSLRSQMNPHFIFNALNSVNTFIASNDERTANKYLSDFSFLMRAVLENSEEDFIPLKKEIELLERYTKLENFRFKDKFDYTIEVDKSIQMDDFEIPPMLLQPYIENAVWHGLRYKKSKGLLKIEMIPKSTNEITINVIDNGIGRNRSKALKTENQKKHNSTGMSNIKKRIQILNAMYKDKIDVTINDFQDADDAGTIVSVSLKKMNNV
jgi:tetratricopeptide (TPR) repeat protein